MASKIFPGSIYAIHFRHHPRLPFDVVPWALKNEHVLFCIYGGDGKQVGSGLKKCSMEDFGYFFSKNGSKPPRPAIIIDLEQSAVEFTERNLKLLASGLESALF